MPESLSQAIEVVFFTSNLMISPLYMLSFATVALLIYIWRKEEGGFFRWLFPARIYLHKSTRADLGLFMINQVLAIFGLFARFAAVPAVAAYVAGVVPYSPMSDLQLSAVGLALMLFVAGDFSLYWVHRIFHTIKAIWPLHAVHHSAEVLSPITTYRQHPLSGMATTSFNTIVIGSLFGLLVGAFDPSATMLEIAGANAVAVIVNLTITNFQHSHIWISFGPTIERFLISPAQHQVHHSTDPAHFNKNFGQALAIWDWMFGTLYLTKRDEQITFGLNDKADAPLMTHRLWPILWDPIARMIFPARGQ